MVIYKFLKFLIQYLALAIFLMTAVVAGFLIYKGADFSIALGENWFIHHGKSLYLIEPLISRYVQIAFGFVSEKDLWLEIIVPYFLEKTTYITLLVTALLSLVLYLFIRLFP